MNKGFPVTPLSRKDIQATAAYLRSKFPKLPHSEKIAFVQILEVLGSGLLFTLDVVPNHETGNILAFYEPSKRILKLKESVYEGCSKGRSRDVFTVAHEFGHIFLGHTRTLNRTSGDHPIYADSEWQANEFAGELLMPKSIIKEKKLFCAPLIAEFFGVSNQAAEVRLAILKRRNEI